MRVWNASGSGTLPTSVVFSDPGDFMKRVLALLPILLIAASATAFAEYRQIDLTIYGMD